MRRGPRPAAGSGCRNRLPPARGRRGGGGERRREANTRPWYSHLQTESSGQVPDELHPRHRTRALHRPRPSAGASPALASDRGAGGGRARLQLPRPRDGLVRLLLPRTVRRLPPALSRQPQSRTAPPCLTRRSTHQSTHQSASAKEAGKRETASLSDGANRTLFEPVKLVSRQRQERRQHAFEEVDACRATRSHQHGRAQAHVERRRPDPRRNRHEPGPHGDRAPRWRRKAGSAHLRQRGHERRHLHLDVAVRLAQFRTGQTVPPRICRP